ncbi:permease [Agromyces aerolatus]|uniref:permease n=1 Tax=Agromyces sp. LY-1074 TaxID=3074080 RepID=UPI0028654D0A|nr:MULTISPECIES: permease [unclassified Agromyces]MDR5701940.1 permease [Agromyces sp. LY-1074]MDR5708167.1 permease [Agromyces sp. LY-1358]
MSQTLAPPRRPRARSVGIGIGIAGILALVAIRLVAPAELGDVLSDRVQDFITLSVSVVIESLPFVFLGIGLSIGVQLFLPEDFLIRRLPRNPVLRRIVVSLLGVLLPVCECGNVPLARGLIQRGLTVGESMTFLLAAPILNPVTIITTYQAFGWDDGILIARIAGGFLVANLVGWVYSRHPQPMSLLTPRFQAACAHPGSDASSKPRKAARMFAEETSAMLPALFVGSAIAGLIQVAVSRDFLITLGQNPILSVFALMLLAFVISICANVDAFFVLSFGSTFMPGAIVAFLVFGPMIDIKMLALMRTTFTARTLVQLTAIVGLASAAIGLGVNLVA